MTNEIAIFFGRLVGSMINPAVWIIAGAAAVGLRNNTVWLRLIATLGSVLVVGLLLYSADNYLSTFEKARGIFYGLIAGTVWCAVFAAITRFWRRS